MVTMTIEQIAGDGYERMAKFVREGLPPVWCHFVQHDEYLEPGQKPAKLKAGDCVEGQLSIQLVLNYSPADPGEPLGFMQSLAESSHIDAVGRVLKVIDDYEIVGDFGALGDAITVEFETPAAVREGVTIKVTGNLEWEQAEE